MRPLAIAVLGFLFTAGPAAISTARTIPLKQTTSIAAAQLLDCSGATEVDLDNTYPGDNTGLLSNVAGYPCNPWYEPGGEVVFHVFLPEPTMFTATVESDGCDLDLAILNQCDESAGCIDVVDVTYTTDAPLSGDIYFVVDGYDEWGCPFMLTLTEIPLPPAPNFCDLVQPVSGSGMVYGYTCTSGENLVSTGECSAYGAGGLEEYYSVVVPVGFTLTATLYHANDGALWLLSGCENPYPCVSFADDGLGGDPEVVTYTNTTSQELHLFLVVDSYQPNSCGSYEMEIAIQAGPVRVKQATLGAVKSMYR